MKRPWKLMTDEQKARQREYARKYRQSHKGREKALERKRKWNSKNRERKREADRAWYARHKNDTVWVADKTAVKVAWRERNAERYKATQLAWRKKHGNYNRDYMRVWRYLNADYVRAYNKAYNRAYNERNRERIKARAAQYRIKLKITFARDAAKYALWREKNREKNRKEVERQGRAYIPRLNMRIPDYIPFGVGYDFASRSNFVRSNIDTDRLREIDGYYRELRIERIGKRGAA